MEQGKNWEVSGPIDEKCWVTTGEGPISELTVIIHIPRLENTVYLEGGCKCF
jgi:hypothetical protein